MTVIANWTLATGTKPAFVGLVDRLVTSLEALPVEEQPVCWLMAGAVLRDIGASRRRGVELPKVKATYWQAT